MAERHATPDTRPNGLDRDEPRPVETVGAWAPSRLDESDHWRRHLDDEIRPRVDSLKRLRDRDLLD